MGVGVALAAGLLEASWKARDSSLLLVVLVVLIALVVLVLLGY